MQLSRMSKSAAAAAFTVCALVTLRAVSGKNFFTNERMNQARRAGLR